MFLRWSNVSRAHDSNTQGFRFQEGVYMHSMGHCVLRLSIDTGDVGAPCFMAARRSMMWSSFGAAIAIGE